MKKKRYDPPVIQFIEMNYEDVITASGGRSNPGHGYGDNNHHHDGPPGQRDRCEIDIL